MLQCDWTDGLEESPIFSSDIDLFERKKTAKYVKSNIPGPGSNIDDFETQIIGCKCNSVTCDEGKCTCITKYGKNYESGKILFQYLQGNSMAPIFECNVHCKCLKPCNNRLVQRGVRLRLEVFWSDGKGLGLRCLESITKGSFVCEYAGEIISLQEAKFRSSKLASVDMNYILTIQEHHKSGELRTYVDPTHYGNIGRYINHSCSPNLTMLPVRVDHMIPKISLFAALDVEAFDELTFDYGHNSLSEPLDTKTLSTPLKPCLCGSQNCRGYLPFEPSLFK